MEELKPDKLIASDYPVVTDIVTIKSGQNLERGALLGKITVGGKHILCDSAAADGSEKPLVILAEDCDATSADQQAVVYLSGAFNQAAVIFGGTDTAATHRAALRDLNIYLKSAV